MAIVRGERRLSILSLLLAATPVRTVLLGFAMLVALGSGAAKAQPAREALEEIVKCTELADAAKRLECFDRAASRAKAALATPAPAMQAAPERSPTERFGLPTPAPVTKPQDFGKPAPEPEVTQISDAVLEFGKTARGKALFVLANGQVWRQLDGDSTDVAPPARGSTMRVTIEIGFLGSYNLTIEGRAGLIKVSRLK